jgi:hypothetical protein
MTRIRLPDRRPNETATLSFEGATYEVTIGYYLDGQPGEVFTHGAKVGSAMDRLLDDACVALSLLIQHGVKPEDLAAKMGCLGDQRQPASIIGGLVQLLAGGAEQAPVVEATP